MNLDIDEAVDLLTSKPNLDKAVTSILAGVGILGLALAFAFQDIAANFMSGIFLSFRRPLAVGDIVKTNDQMDTAQPTFLQGRHETIMHIKEAFDANVMIPFPIRTLDFGIEGGEKLSELGFLVRRKARKGERRKGRVRQAHLLTHVFAWSHASSPCRYKEFRISL